MKASDFTSAVSIRCAGDSQTPVIPVVIHILHVAFDSALTLWNVPSCLFIVRFRCKFSAQHYVSEKGVYDVEFLCWELHFHSLMCLKCDSTQWQDYRHMVCTTRGSLCDIRLCCVNVVCRAVGVSRGSRSGCDPQRGEESHSRQEARRERNITQSTAKVTHLHRYTHGHVARGHSVGWHKDSHY